MADRGARFLLPIAAGVVVGLATVCLLVRQIWWDQAWCLYVGGRLFAGDHLYGADIQDTNPPLIYWLATIPAAIGQAIGVDADHRLGFMSDFFDRRHYHLVASPERGPQSSRSAAILAMARGALGGTDNSLALP